MQMLLLMLTIFSYGGHYGPSFYNYFYQQNEAIRNGSVPGVELQMDTLGIINGIIDEGTGNLSLSSRYMTN